MHGRAFRTTAGESWAYRARQEARNAARPARVLVRFVDERFEGRQEWVPPARLKVPWAAVGVFREREARWDRIDKLGIGDEPVGSYPVLYAQ
jgi:hypothetical protein